MAQQRSGGTPKPTASFVRSVNGREQLRFLCDTGGASLSFKANRNRMTVTVFAESLTGFGIGFRSDAGTDGNPISLATMVFEAGGYSWCKLNHYADQCVAARRAARPLPGSAAAETPVAAVRTRVAA